LKLAFKRFIPIIIYGIPIPGRNNPYISYPTSSKVLFKFEDAPEKFKLKLYVNEEFKDIIQGEIKRFLQALEETLDFKVEGSFTVKVDKPITPLSTIASILSGFKYVMESLGYPLTLYEYIEVCRRALKFKIQHQGMFETLLATTELNRGVIYRLGEGYIELPKIPNFKVFYKYCLNVKAEYLGSLNPLLNAIVALSGRLVIEAANSIRESNEEMLELLHRMEEHIAKILYNINSECNDKIVDEPYGTLFITITPKPTDYQEVDIGV